MKQWFVVIGNVLLFADTFLKAVNRVLRFKVIKMSCELIIQDLHLGTQWDRLCLS